MPRREEAIAARAGRPVFVIACWGLGLMALVQLLVVGMALATRFEESRVVRVVEKEVIKPVVVRVPARSSGPGETPVVSRPPPESPPAVLADHAHLPPPTPLAVPRIADPRAERLVDEARQARVAGDMGRAIIKLEEAGLLAADDPSIHYELGLVHEHMGVFDRATAHYDKVFQMGVRQAGKLYEMAATKLRDGFEQPGDMLGKLSLGNVRVFKNPHHDTGEQVVLTIPVQKAPGEEIDVAGIEVSVMFFNRTARGEIIPLDEPSWVSEQWVSLPFDWAGGEESLRMTYTIPPQDERTEHLFGSRSYYGQVVTLSYQGEILDVQAWPRDLAARLPGAQPAAFMDSPVLPDLFDDLPFDFDPERGVLPPPLPE